MAALEFIDNDIRYIVGRNESQSMAVKLCVWRKIAVSTKIALSKHIHTL